MSDPVPPSHNSYRVSKPPNGLHAVIPRSCVPCHRRKVKCDRSDPCSNCVRLKLNCHFPDPNHAIRRPRKPATQDAAELVRRLRTLESVVEQWSGKSAEEKHDDDPDKDASPSDVSIWTGSTDEGQAPEQEMGRLMVNEGRSRYVRSNFWASLSEEVGLSHHDFNISKMCDQH